MALAAALIWGRHGWTGRAQKQEAGRGAVAHAGWMFAAAEVTVVAGIDDAGAWLTQLISGGALHAPSEDAYEGGSRPWFGWALSVARAGCPSWSGYGCWSRSGAVTR
jgi:hypothetical protein